MTGPLIAAVDAGVVTRIGEVAARRAGDAFGFLERLVASESTVGREAGAQEIFATEMERLGLSVGWRPIPGDIGDDPLGGVPQCSYEGRANVLATTGPGDLALLINGHIDVVPADPTAWSGSPWNPEIRDGWLHGRGAGDMKGGFAMAALALDVLREADPAALELPIGFLSVIEEECTGNGTLAAVRDGIVADVVVLPEPTDLDLLLGGTGIVWLDVVVSGGGGHAESADRVQHPLDVALRLVPALEDLGRRTGEEVGDDALAGIAHPYNVNVGTVRAGDWRSSVASVARLGVRFGHPRSWKAECAIAEVTRTVADAVGEAPVEVSVVPVGYRAEGYLIDAGAPLVRALADSHARVHGRMAKPYVLGSTTDARYYVNTAEVPAVCFGPTARRIHGAGEAVELSSIVDGARTLATFVAGVAAAR